MEGNLCIKIVQEGNVKRDVHLPAGYVWLLPGQIPHNPQREVYCPRSLTLNIASSITLFVGRVDRDRVRTRAAAA